MSLCPPARCGCSFESTTLDLDRSGDSISIELPDAYSNAWPLFTFLNATERDAELPSGVRQEGMEAFLRAEDSKYRFVNGVWSLVSRPVTTYSPSTTDLTIGAGGSLLARYMVADGMCTVWMRLVLGTGFAIVNPSFSLPVPIAFGGVAVNRWPVVGTAFDSGSNLMYGLGGEIVTTTSRIYFYVIDGSDGKTYGITSTNPMTFAPPDEIWGTVSYPTY